MGRSSEKKVSKFKNISETFWKIQQSARYSIWPCHQFFVVAHFCYDVTLYTYSMCYHICFSFLTLSLVVKGHKDSIVYTWKGNVICRVDRCDSVASLIVTHMFGRLSVGTWTNKPNRSNKILYVNQLSAAYTHQHFLVDYKTPIVNDGL
jgi:hypothetical protein